MLHRILQPSNKSITVPRNFEIFSLLFWSLPWTESAFPLPFEIPNPPNRNICDTYDYKALGFMTEKINSQNIASIFQYMHSRLEAVLGIRIRRISMFLGLPDPDPYSQRYGSRYGFGSFPFLINVLSKLK
jgi:hypothetical protein